MKRSKPFDFSLSSQTLIPLAFTTLMGSSPMIYAATNGSDTDDGDTSTIELPQIQVTADGARSATEKTAREEGSVSDVSAEDLDDTVSYSVDDIFRYDPSVLTTDNGRFGLSGFNVRGLDENRISIQFDGLEAAEAYGPTSSYLNSGRLSTDIESLAGVSVIKGGNAQSGAGFSTVSMQLASPENFLEGEGDDAYASVKGGYRSDNNGFFETATVAGRRGDYEAMLIVTNRNADNTENYFGDGEGDTTIGDERTEPNPGDVDNYNVLMKLQKRTDSGRIGVVAEKYKATSELRLYSEESASGFVTYDDYTTDDSLTRYRLGLYQEAELDTVLFDNLHWQLDWQDTETVNRSEMVYSGYNRLVDRDYTQTTYQLKTDFSKDLTFGVPQQIAYGLTLKQDDYDSLQKDINLDSDTVSESRFSPKGKATRIGLYLQDRLSLADNRGSLTPAVRFDSYDYDLDSDGLTSLDYDGASGEAVTGQIGGTWDFTPNLQLFGKTGLGFRTPSYDELYYDYDGGRGYRFVANPDLDDEHSKFVELGLRAQGRYGNAELTGFYTDYDDFIQSSVSVSVDPANYPYGEYTTENVDRAIIRGVEFKGALDLNDAVGLADGWYSRTAAAYIEGKNLEDGTALESIPPIQAVLALGFEDPDNAWGAEVAGTFVNHVSDYDAGDGQFAPSAYQLYDLTAHVTPLDGLTLRGGVFNLTDKKYWVWDDVRGIASSTATANRLSEPGLNFGVSAEYVF
ncbi:TonB-dependent hemoglobin/transferrin/lactoferrin family receptor [Marinobacter sp. JSM 1782161]|uniref:TonB-dependent hemoglobin/transferrin/lactoferrin family receptor n=1 Tax=Marinobacter sp. JSM 1782161 TaxID=2685906 RepID=UPI001403F663|nr:TonB-dependent hemoglobin/transferrin/lactoferrin family receptor [Marinobacter sp. JSM 1782161]